MSRKFVNTSTHPIDTPTGGIVAPGGTVEIKDVDAHVQSHIDAGLLVEVEDPKDKGGKN